MYVAKRGEVVAMRKQISYLQKETNRNFEKYPKQPKNISSNGKDNVKKILDKQTISNKNFENSQSRHEPMKIGMLRNNIAY